MSFDEIIAQFGTDGSGRILIRPDELKALLKDSASASQSAAASNSTDVHEADVSSTGELNRLISPPEGSKSKRSGLAFMEEAAVTKIEHRKPVNTVSNYECADGDGDIADFMSFVKAPSPAPSPNNSPKNPPAPTVHKALTKALNIEAVSVMDSNSDSDEDFNDLMSVLKDEKPKTVDTVASAAMKTVVAAPAKLLDRFRPLSKIKMEKDEDESNDVSAKDSMSSETKVSSTSSAPKMRTAVHVVQFEQRIREKMEKYNNSNSAVERVPPASNANILDQFEQRIKMKKDGDERSCINAKDSMSSETKVSSTSSTPKMRTAVHMVQFEQRIREKMGEEHNSAVERVPRISNVKSLDQFKQRIKMKREKHSVERNGVNAKDSMSSETKVSSTSSAPKMKTAVHVVQSEQRIREKMREDNNSAVERVPPTSNANVLDQFKQRIKMKKEMDDNERNGTTGANARTPVPPSEPSGENKSLTMETPEERIQMKVKKSGKSAVAADTCAKAKNTTPDEATSSYGSMPMKLRLNQFQERIEMKLKQDGEDGLGVTGSANSQHITGDSQTFSHSDLANTEPWQDTSFSDSNVSNSVEDQLGPPTVEADTVGILRATSRWTRQNHHSSSGDGESFFENDTPARQDNNMQNPQGLPSVYASNDWSSRWWRGRARMHTSQSESLHSSSTASTFRRVSRMFSRSIHLVSAHLVEENDSEVVLARRVNYLERKWKTLVSISLLAIMAVMLLLLLANPKNDQNMDGIVPQTMQPSSPHSSIPSMQPSTSPSFDPRPTLKVVQARGHVRCLLSSGEDNPTEKERIELCRSIAAVLFGDPENYRVSTSKWSDAFGQLNSRNADVMIRSVTHTVEREVRETSTGVGFSFSSPYYYDGMAYFGNETFVRCAEEKRRYNECSSLRICVPSFTTIFDFVQSSFPSNFLKVFSSEQTDELMEMVWNGTCVRAIDRSLLLPYASSDRNSNKNYIVGDKLMTKEPHAIVTRNDDREFSDIINWVVHALYYGQEQGMTNSSSFCQSYANLTLTVADLNFLNAVHCVGNLGQVMSNIVQYSNGMDEINNGTTGMLYATPFGELGHAHDGIATGGLLDDIRNDQGSLKCGVIVPVRVTRYIAESDQLVGMSIDYCRTIAAALFDGNFEAVKLLNFSDTDSSSFDALNNGTIDVLAGARVELKYDFESSPSLGGFQFSSPYYYGNETARDDVSSFSLATREDDVLLSSFVNIIVLSTLHAQEIGITRERSSEMPSMSTFGSEFSWALRDAISYSGSYDEMYSRNFGDVLEEDRGRNTVNNKGGPQIHSFPGLNFTN